MNKAKERLGEGRTGGSQSPCLTDDIKDYSDLGYLTKEIIRIGAVVESVQLRDSAVDSPGFIPLTANVNEIGNDSKTITGDELRAVFEFRRYKEKLDNTVVLIENLVDSSLAKLIDSSDGSRYFKEGRRRVKGKIYKRLGRWFHCPGLLISLTYDPKIQSRAVAWLKVGLDRRAFMNSLNIWRKRRGMPKAKCLSVIEEQKQTGYPHVHIVFPHLKWLANVDFMTQAWGQASNSVDISVRDNFSPVAYVCKYITKLEGWSEVALSYLWTNRTRMYSMSRDYTLPDYSDKRIPQWSFQRTISKTKVFSYVAFGMGGYDTILGAERVLPELFSKDINN